MDEAQKLKHCLGRISRKLSRIKIRDGLAITQTIIAALMLLSLWQSHKTLLLTKQQIESSIPPVLDLRQDNDTLHFENVGSVTISKLEVVARLAAHYDMRTDKIAESQLGTFQQVICQKLEPGGKEILDLKKIIIPSESYAVSGERLEAYCLVLCYWRSADLKPFYKLVYFYRSKTNSPPDGTYLYWPVSAIYNGVSGAPYPFPNLKSELRSYCLQQLDLPGLEDN